MGCRSVLLAVLVLSATACAADDAPEPMAEAPFTWDCPPEWVPHARGGCAPAVLACPDEAGGPGACDGFDPETPGMETGFHVRPDGVLSGAWDTAPTAAPVVEPTPGVPTCPDAWMRLADGTCDPQLPTTCSAGAAPLPGGRCTPTADADCPAGEYATLPPEAGGATPVHVREAADPTVADGTVAAPYATIGAALSVASGGWILVAAGTYRERLNVRNAAAHVLGACAARTVIEADDAGSVVEVARGTFDLRGVTVRGGDPGVRVVLGADATLDGVVVDGARTRGVYVRGPGTTASLSGSVVRNTRLVPDMAGGVWVEDRAMATVRGTSVEDNAEAGLVAYSGAQLDAEGSVIRGTTSTAGQWGNATWAQGGATMALREMVVDDNAAHLISRQPGTAVTVTDSVVRGGGTMQGGLLSVADGALDAERVLIEDVGFFGAIAVHAPGSIRASVVRRVAGGRFMDEIATSGVVAVFEADLVAEDVLVDEVTGIAFTAVEDARATATGSVFRRTMNPEGVAVTATGSDVELTDVLIEDNDAAGILAERGGTLRATRVLVQRNRRIGAIASEMGSALELRDSAILDTGFGPGGIASGLGAQRGATTVAERTLIAGSAAFGAGGSSGGVLRLTDVAVRDIAPSGEASGRCVEVNDGTTAMLVRVVAEDCRDIGLAATDGGALDAEDIVIRRVRTGFRGLTGWGLAAAGTGRVTARRVVVEDATEAALVGLGPSEMTVEDVLVSRVVPSSRGFGVGVSAFGASVTATRVAVRSIAGAGAIATPFDDGGSPLQASVRLTDAWVREVSPSTLGLTSDFMPSGPMVAYGLHAGTGCTLDAERFVATEGAFGFFASHASTTLRTGVIADQLEAAGAVAPGVAEADLTLIDIELLGNGVDDIVPAPVALPEATALPPPTPVCVGC